ncbi:hypothetical protein EDD86DRAFT_243987 [Gorgonomyces haynaldii]|nr:hypothetical protein EDD86DRAFT_243987 [Gorgonomyces haynaldii]
MYIAQNPNIADQKDKLTKEPGFNVLLFAKAGFASAIGLFVSSIYMLYHDPPLVWTATDYTLLWLSTLAFLFRAWAMHTLKEFFTFQLTIRPDHKLITHGPYAILRHPSYTGLFFGYTLQAMFVWYQWYQFGLCPMWMAITAPSVQAIIMFLALIKRIHNEEIHLSDHFEDEWKKYCATRWRLVPYLY